MELRAVAPEAWMRFLLAMATYRSEQADKMIGVSLEMLPRAQGMALAVDELNKLFVDAPKLHEKMQNSRIGKRHG